MLLIGIESEIQALLQHPEIPEAISATLITFLRDFHSQLEPFNTASTRPNGFFQERSISTHPNSLSTSEGMIETNGQTPLATFS